jgi:invasion protein IalB
LQNLVLALPIGLLLSKGLNLLIQRLDALFKLFEVVFDVSLNRGCSPRQPIFFGDLDSTNC